MKKILTALVLINMLASPFHGIALAETAENPQNPTSTVEPEQTKSGFVTEENNTYYYLPTTNEVAKGWQFIDHHWYYFDPESGKMQTGWILVSNNWYYLSTSGVMQSGWLLDGNKWYYLNQGGSMAVGWKLVSNKWYYLEQSGAMKTGWLYDKNNWYYLTQTGVMTTGWYTADHGWYYSYSNGIMAKNTTMQGYTLGNSGGWLSNLVIPKQVYSYLEMEADIRELAMNYPGFIQTEVIGRSVDGRNLYAVKIGKGKKEIFFNGSHHAREHMTTNLLMEMLDQYAQSYANKTNFNGYNVRQLLDQVSIWFVPMVNPDGVMLVQEGAYTAKNPQYVLSLNGNRADFSSWKANIRGVDLNRQYPADWENIRDNSTAPGPSHFKGYQPLSEPEVQAIYNFTKAHSFKIAVAYHSAGQILYWNYKQAYYERERDHAIAVKYANLTGYSLVYPGSNPSGGGYTDWFIQEMKLPGFTPEISPYTNGKPVPLANYDNIWKQNSSAGLLMAKEALNL
jgi:murein tripeptide amidase MpaA